MTHLHLAVLEDPINHRHAVSSTWISCITIQLDDLGWGFPFESLDALWIPWYPCHAAELPYGQPGSGWRRGRHHLEPPVALGAGHGAGAPRTQGVQLHRCCEGCRGGEGSTLAAMGWKLPALLEDI